MTLQQKILQRYRFLFPNETLRETSSKTSIQITRVFRLFNGKSMKVQELESFERIITEKLSENPNVGRLNSVIEKSLSVLTNEELDKISNYIERKIACRELSRVYMNSDYNNASIA